jgi:3-hydroxy acid dehydrogenase / malonic semialdehyde reductase
MSILHNHTIFITGATSGFGEACARKYAALGARLILTGRRKERLEQLQQELGNKDIHIIPLDVRDKAAVAKSIASLPERFAPITILINNAGLALGLEPAHECVLEDWEQMVDTNIKGLIYCTRMILPQMVKANRGMIINIGSTAGTYPYPGANVYGASKAFVRQFSLNLRADLLGTAVRVTNIEPGMAETEFSAVRFKGDEGKAGAVYEGVTPISAEDVADTALWCITRPAHLNINSIEMMPVQQASGHLAVSRKG